MVAIGNSWSKRLKRTDGTKRKSHDEIVLLLFFLVVGDKSKLSMHVMFNQMEKRSNVQNKEQRVGRFKCLDTAPI